jgi:hypothetical protein
MNYRHVLIYPDSFDLWQLWSTVPTATPDQICGVIEYMTQATRIYKHSAAGTDWAALMLGAGLGLTLGLAGDDFAQWGFSGFLFGGCDG